MGWGGVQVGGEPDGGQAVEEPVEQAQVHSADEFGVLLSQDVEGAVGEDDVVAFDARFEAVFLEYPQRGVPGVAVTVGVARGFPEFSAQLIGTLVEDRVR
ncbi:MAG: hypothetical protein ACT4NY_20785 [Pseudonocardiales bacterium]